MPKNDEMTCRLLAASAVSYWIERAGGITAAHSIKVLITRLHQPF